MTVSVDGATAAAAAAASTVAAAVPGSAPHGE